MRIKAIGFFQRHDIGILLGLITFYFLVRLPFLTSLPIYNDEAIYIRWAQLALENPDQRFISLSAGKQPLFTWLLTLAIAVSDNYLVIGRLLTISIGFLTAAGLFFLSYTLFKEKIVGYLTVLFYIVYPFAQVNDRMILLDSLLAMFFIWSIGVAVHLVRTPRISLAYTLGFVLGGGMLTKSSGIFSVYLLPLTFILIPFWKKRERVIVGKIIVFFFFAFLIAKLLYSIQLLSLMYERILWANGTFIYPIREWLTFSLQFRLQNFIVMVFLLSKWLLTYLTPSLSFLIIFSFFSRQYIREKIMLFLYFLIPFLLLSIFARNPMARYIYFMTLPLLPLAAWACFLILRKLKSTSIKYTVILMAILYPLIVSLWFAADPIRAPIADKDRKEYANFISAGFGIDETVYYLNKQSKQKQLIVITEGIWGIIPDALQAYHHKNPNIEIVPIWPFKNIPTKYASQSRKKDIYLVLIREKDKMPKDPSLKLILSEQEGESKYYYNLYKLIQ